MKACRHLGTGTAVATILLLAPAATLFAASARRLTRLDDSPTAGFVTVGSSPSRVGGTIFFPTWDPKNGWAMRASDGSSPHSPILRGARAQVAVAFAGRAFFIGADATSSRLWESDASPSGTTSVAELGGPSAGALAAVGGNLYLVAGDGHPWRSDGTAAGTLRLSEDATVEGAGPTWVEWNGAVYFLGFDGNARLGLWATAGAPSSTRTVVDLGPAPNRSRFAYGLFGYGGRLFFFTMEEPNGARYRLWSWDGVAASALALHDFPGTFRGACPGPCFGIGPETLAGLGGRLVFFADDGVHGRELWRTDGTAVGTQLLADISPSSPGVIASFQDPLSSGSPGSYALFAADDGVHGDELWRTDGTAAGTYLLADIVPGPPGSYPFGFVAVGEQTFFATASSIWRTDGTASGTVLFRDGAATLYPIDGGFAAVDGGGLWVSDGATLTLVDDLARPRGLEPAGLTLFGSGLAFSRLDDDNTLHDVWRYDADAGTADVLHHFAAMSTLPEPAGGALYFGANDGVHGFEPWISDGTEAGTRLLHDVASGALDSSPSGFTAAGSSVFFSAWDATHGVELWATDGTDAGTRLVEDFQPGEYGSVPGDLTAFQEALSFTIAYPQGGLWRTDGTAPGTRETAPVPASFLVNAGGTLFFVGLDPATGSELWASDGTAAGTRLVKDAVPGPASENFYGLTPAGSRIFYIGQGDAGQELWTSDGSTPGTMLLATFHSLDGLTALGSAVFFTADDGEHGFELWTSDGTGGGTRLVRDIAPGLESSSPSWLASSGGRILFAADDGVHGIEPWVSDGTAEGTRMLEDLSPGPASSDPEAFCFAGSTVFFRASDDEAGAQLWSIPASALEPRPGTRPRTPRVLQPRP